jgi:hypothetical protein
VPIAGYFLFVGGALAALLFVAGWCLPAPPAMFADQPQAVDRAIIRIRSAHKWPGKVVLDTSRPTITPPVVEEPVAVQALAVQSIRLPPDERKTQSNLEAMAQLKSDTRPATLQVKRRAATTVRSNRRVTRRLARAEVGGFCCQFGWIDNSQTISNATVRKGATSFWPME